MNLYRVILNEVLRFPHISVDFALSQHLTCQIYLSSCITLPLSTFNMAGLRQCFVGCDYGVDFDTDIADSKKVLAEVLFFQYQPENLNTDVEVEEMEEEVEFEEDECEDSSSEYTSYLLQEEEEEEEEVDAEEEEEEKDVIDNCKSEDDNVVALFGDWHEEREELFSDWSAQEKKDSEAEIRKTDNIMLDNLILHARIYDPEDEIAKELTMREMELHNVKVTLKSGRFFNKFFNNLRINRRVRNSKFSYRRIDNRPDIEIALKNQTFSNSQFQTLQGLVLDLGAPSSACERH